MIQKVYSPIFYFLLVLLITACTKTSNDKTDNYTLMSGKANSAIAIMQLDSAYFYYNLAKESCADKTNLRYTYALYQIANIQQLVGDYYGSEETVTEALTNHQDTIYKSYLYNILAIAYDKQKNFDGAMRYYKKVFETSKDNTLKAVSQNNIGVIHLEKKEYKNAIQKLKPLLSNRFLKTEKIELARVLDNLGYAQFKLNLPEAYSNLSRSLQLRDSLQDAIGLMPSNIHLSEYFKEVDKKQAQKYATDALRATKKVSNPDDELEALNWLIQISDPAPAKQYAIDFIQLSDSLSQSRSHAKNQFAKIKFDATKALQESEKQKSQKQIYFILFLFTIATATLLFVLIRSRNKNKLKSITYTTETRISKKLHDELANDVYNTMTFAETQDLQNPDKRETLLDNLDKIYSRTRNISKENSTINTDEQFETNLKEMLSSFISKDRNVIIKNDTSIQWSKVASEKKIAIYRVLQELLVNMKKHSQSTLVVIGFELKGNTIEINYTDNGIGCSEKVNLKNGLQNAENRIHTIKGKITFESETGKGFKSKIVFPQ